MAKRYRDEIQNNLLFRSLPMKSEILILSSVKNELLLMYDIVSIE